MGLLLADTEDNCNRDAKSAALCYFLRPSLAMPPKNTSIFHSSKQNPGRAYHFVGFVSFSPDQKAKRHLVVELVDIIIVVINILLWSRF